MSFLFKVLDNLQRYNAGSSAVKIPVLKLKPESVVPSEGARSSSPDEGFARI